MHPELFARLTMLETALRDVPRDLKLEVGEFRKELKQELVALSTGLQTRLGQSEQGLGQQFSSLRTEAAQARKDAEEALGRHVSGFSEVQTRRLSETNVQMKALQERVEAQQKEARGEQKQALEAIAIKLLELTNGNAEQQEQLREQLRTQVSALREGNEKKLDEMRGVVDEKLSATLEQRLGEKFKTVSDHLESVHKAVGEMQSLATGVGDLKRVLTNVKARGGWGELRLGQLLQDMLTPDQYESQVAVRAGAGERVDFAVKLPGRSDDGPVWLPIDCKFPQEDYDRLQSAQEAGDPAAVEAGAAALERAVRVQAKSLAAKYVHPPHTTPFAILYLPTEGLFAEVIRRPGLVSDLQQSVGVMVTGPTTLAAILNSLQMGFRSLAVEKRSADVWKVLGEAKAEFAKYGQVWGKLGEKLKQAQDLHETVAVRSRAVERKLRGVEGLEAPGVAVEPAPETASAPLFALAGGRDDAAVEDEAA